MTTILTEIKNVQERTITKRDGSPFTLNEVIAGDGTVWVARKDVANVARQFIGHPVEMTTRTEQNGNYTNRYVDHVQLRQSQGGYAGQPEQAMMPVQQSPPPQPVPQQAAPPPQPPQEGPTQRDLMIYRQVAAKVSAALSTTQAEFWGNCDDLVTYFAYGVKPNVQPSAPALTQGVYPTAPTTGGTATNSYYATPPHGDSDIPF